MSLALIQDIKRYPFKIFFNGRMLKQNIRFKLKLIQIAPNKMIRKILYDLTRRCQSKIKIMKLRSCL
ncbi:hypothetical protein YP76_09835 [Sphingobium chungbukense]|uniref:Uncharacterized protein n=1 Tax=Sphingobium chungbukense TaxID=56193 RepID=A0A0M3AQW8_9SPHN|nr:hypothetical protein YP76_09835 [Sphingobium chungbukense]